MPDTPDQYGVIGHPIGHSWSPFIHGLFARHTGQNLAYKLYDVPPEQFRKTALEFFAKGGKGLNVTVPHKQVALEFANELTPRAERAGAVNTLAAQAGAVLGDNTDGAGLVRDLRDNLGITVTHRDVLVIGAGGATRGILGPLLALDPAEILITNRAADRARQLAQEFGDIGPVRACSFENLDPTPADIVINATAAGLSGETPAINTGVIGPNTICYDLTYGKDETPFTAWARKHGARAAFKGWGMLVEQAAESFFLWRGVRPETQEVIKALVDERPRLQAR